MSKRSAVALSSLHFELVLLLHLGVGHDHHDEDEQEDEDDVKKGMTLTSQSHKREQSQVRGRPSSLSCRREGGRREADREVQLRWEKSNAWS